MAVPTVNFLPDDAVRSFAREHGTPVYVYSKERLSLFAKRAMQFKGPYGTTIRYAVKANSHKEIIRLFDSMGLYFDASSGGEVELLIRFGVRPSHITLNSQELPDNLQDLVQKGVRFVATSLHQLETYCSLFAGSTVGVRLNPGVGNGESNKVTTGGVAAGFGIWHEYIPDIQSIAAKNKVTITMVHTHIGAGTDPLVWQEVANITLGLAEQFSTVTHVSLGGGFKVERMDDEQTADIAAIGSVISGLLRDFAKRTGRKLHVEIEPGTYLTALSGLLLTSVQDITNTGASGYTFIRTNTGMNDILRPTLYGAQHPLWLITNSESLSTESCDYVVIGHNCESGDILTPQRGNPDMIATRTLPKANIGDIVVIGGAGAYCASMRAVGYNAFKPAKEIVI